MARIVWWEIETSDPERFQEFHSALSGWTFERDFEDSELEADYWVIRHGGEEVGGGLQRGSATLRPSTGARVYFAVDDLETELDRVVRLGGTVERPRTELGGDDRWYGVYKDPTGVSFGLWTANPARG